MTGHVTVPAAALADDLPSWATLVRAANPGPMTLDGTNTWVLRAPGATGCVVVDPGPDDTAHLQAVARYGPVESVRLTHGHPDHTAGLAHFQALTGARLDAPYAGLRIERIPTPGHTADSACYLVSTEAGEETAVLTGDTILGRGTTVVAWPDGDLGDYLASLGVLIELGSVPVLPGHGPALASCAAAARFYLAHRRARLDQVRAAVDGGARTPGEVVAAVYSDVDRSLWFAAEWSVRAQLAYLELPGSPESGGRESGGRESGSASAGLSPP